MSMMSMLLALSIMLFPGGAAENDVWPGFLGAGATDYAAAKIPTTWGPSDHLAWKTALPGHGQSSPVVWKGKVYLTSIEGPEKDTNHVYCLDLSDGKLLWTHSSDSSFKVKNSYYVSRAAPTPVADAQGVIAFFESGDLIALDEQGQVRWTRSLAKEGATFKNRFGLGASLVQHKNHVIVLVDDEGPSYLLAVDKSTGKDAWRTERTSRVSWSSPALVDVGGTSVVVVSSAGSVDGYDPETGNPLWSFDEVGGNTSNTPVPFGSGKFLVGASQGQRREYAGIADKSNVAMQVVIEDGKPQLKKLWTAEKVFSSFASPMVHAGYAYWVNQAGVVFCFDAKTGENVYSKRIDQSCWATPVGIGDRVYFFGKDGITTVLQAGPEFKKLASNRLWNPEDVKIDSNERGAETFGGPIQYGVAIAGDSLLVRTGEVLYCVRP